ncbi:MAG: DUF4293 family protein [Sphingobacteriales bacterium]|nr:MAG: DUF4293 family protein [Sphingobacteriales bacterium]TAF80455.1 MAG: DUF4293 family protein [Sphingobacteriales bacterium]
MLQRIQSVYLFIASMVIYALFIFPVASVFNNIGAQKIMVNGAYQAINNEVVKTESFLPLTIATILLGLLPLVLIFLYKNRNRQQVLIYGLVVIVLAHSYWLTQTVQNISQSVLKMSDYGIGAGLPSVAILFLVLAAKAVGRDEKLVKSADRLR